jgi:tetratricopeptide (TPR) repeat protein
MVLETPFDPNVTIAAAASNGKWENVIEVWQLRPVDSLITEQTYLSVAKAYSSLKQTDEADRALSEAVLQYPLSLSLNAELGWLAIRMGRLETALERWERVLTNFSNEAVGVIGYAAALTDLRRFALADMMLFGGKVKFPDSVRMATDYARLAQVAGRPEEGETRWKELIELFPNQHVGYHGYAVLLRNLGRLDEAITVIERGLAKLPNNRELRVFFAWLATYKQQWAEAEARWSYVKSHFELTDSLSRELALGLGEIKLGRELNAIDQVEKHPAVVIPSINNSAVEDDNGVDFKNWQSLGDDCEFGLVQRHFGCEPIGLLRWASTTIPQLTAALNRDFDGIGDIDNTVVENRQGEYACYDKRFGMVMHTFIRVSVRKQDEVLDVMANRMKFLKRKLQEDLEDGDHNFIYKSKKMPSESELILLHEAMQRHGKNNLVVTLSADEHHKSGSLQVIGRGLLVGYLQRFGNRGGNWDIDFAGWRGICEAAQRLLPAS